ncbi:MAG: EAL domain-containing protein [Pseudomonadota bacterium]
MHDTVPVAVAASATDTAPINILFVEDNPADRVLMEETFADTAGVDLDCVDRLAGAIAALGKRDYDLVLLDLSLPDSFGIDTFESIRAHTRERPIIILSGNRDERTAIEAVRQGAQDYLTKGQTDGEQLLKTFRYAIERSNTRRELLRSRARYQRLYENVLAGVYQMDLDGSLLSANPEMRRLLGFDSEDALLGRNMRNDVFADADDFDRHLEELLHGSDRRNSEIRIRRDDGEQRVMLDSSTVVRERNGCIRFIEGTLIDITERKRAERKLEFLAQYDKLTGLANRYLFRDEAQRVIANADRNQTRAAVLLLDLDNFKAVNDTLGHDAGDRLLQHVAGRMRAALRTGDLIARLGGDEFAVLIDAVPEPAAIATVAGKLLAAVGAPLTIGGRAVDVTPSIGIATCPDAATELDELLRAADVAMYRAKQGGRNRFEFYTEAMHRTVLDNAALESALRTAVAEDRLTIDYQPHVNLETGEIAAFEALLRWQCPERGDVAREVFVPLLESSGLIVDVGRRVLQRATAALAGWQRDSARPDLRVSVNVSPRQMLAPEAFAADVALVLEQSGIQPSCLELELTEAALLNDSEICDAALKQIGDTGVGVVVDDFGRGFASLKHLRALPINRVKIDRGVVGAAPFDDGDLALIEASVAMASRLGLGVTLEGVETRSHAAYLATTRCDMAQGLHYGGPVPADGVAELLGGGRGDQGVGGSG